MFIDSHAHIHMLVKEKGCQISEIIDEMKKNSVGAVMNICGNEDELIFSQQIRSAFSDSGISFFSVAGFHPHEAEKYIDSPTRWISDNSDSITAVGEIGLDFHYDFSPRETQRKMLRKMTDLSLELQKPLIIHGRNGEDEIIETLLEYGLKDKKVLFHCYTGSLETAMKIFKNGWYLSFSGIVTFNRSIELQKILENSPVDRIFFETDSPFLAPVPFRGKVNTPAKVRYVYEFASRFLNIEVSGMQKKVKDNFERFLNIKMP